MTHKLLLADDSVTIQRVVELTFSGENVQVVTVGDGEQAIARIPLERPDIVLADIGMPKRSGYDVSAFVKGRPDLSHIPVLLLAGAFEPVDDARAQQVKCDGVLVKPFEPQVVINRVKDLLAGRRVEKLWAGQTPTRPSEPQPPRPLAAGTEAREPAVAHPPSPLLPPSPASPRASLDDYFDRLDAAFASMEGTVIGASSRPASQGKDVRSVMEFDPSLDPPGPAKAPGQGSDDPAGWDPELSAEPAKPVPDARRSGEPEPPCDAAPSMRADTAPAFPGQDTPAGREPAPAAPMPSLAEAFAMLLSTEQGRSVIAASIPTAPPSDAIMEEIVHRVIERMGEKVVRDAVLDVAERLVTQEIERIKGGGRA